MRKNAPILVEEIHIYQEVSHAFQTYSTYLFALLCVINDICEKSKQPEVIIISTFSRVLI